MLFETPIDITDFADTLRDGVYVTDRSRRIVYWNPAAERITGYAADEVVGRSCADGILIHVDQQGQKLCGGACPLNRAMCDKAGREADIILHHKNGHEVPVSVRVRPVVDGAGRVIGAVEVFSDESPVEALHRRVALLEELALIDPLTRVPNQRYLASEVVSQLTAMKGNGAPVGVVFMDVDRLQRFNDQHGYDAGNLALQVVARTLSTCARAHDSVGRWGGGSFLALMPNTAGPALKLLAERMCRMVRDARVPVGITAQNVTISAGATLAAVRETPTKIVGRVEDLMRASKRAGGDCVTTETRSVPDHAL